MTPIIVPTDHLMRLCPDCGGRGSYTAHLTEGGEPTVMTCGHGLVRSLIAASQSADRLGEAIDSHVKAVHQRSERDEHECAGHCADDILERCS